MPLASAGKMLTFPVETTNSYGRDMITETMRVHDHLIENAPILINNKIDPVYMNQMETMHARERWKPSYNEVKRMADDDILLAHLIRDASHR